MNDNNIGGVNVAPSSTSGHFINGANKVLNIDKEKEVYFVEGASSLTNVNHVTLVQKVSSLITTQVVFNPFTKMYENSKD